MHRKVDFALFAILLTISLGYGYASSLQHLPRGDHWWFLLNTLETHGFWDTFRDSYSYNRTREINPADVVLFRPFLFAILSLEKGMFGTHLWAYQATGVILHGVLCLQLFGLLRTLQSANPEIEMPTSMRKVSMLLPFLFAWFFAVNTHIVELVIWTHLHGYLFFFICVLASLQLVLLAIGDDAQRNWNPRYLALAWCMMLIASFTMEFGQVYIMGTSALIIVFGKSMSVTRRTVIVAIAFLVPVIFQLANRIDLHVHVDSSASALDSGMDAELSLNDITTGSTATNMYRFIKFSSIAPFFPFSTHWSYKFERVFIVESSLSEYFSGSLIHIFALVVVLSFVSLLGAGIVRLAATPFNQTSFTFLNALGFFVVYTGVIVLLRLNKQDGFSLSSNSYYAYWPLLLTIIVIFCLLVSILQSEALMRSGYVRRVVILLCGSLAASGLVSLHNTHLLNTVLAKGAANERALLTQVDTFISQHDDSAPVTFLFDYANSVSIREPLDCGIPLTTILYRRFEIGEEPRFVLTYDGNTIQSTESIPETIPYLVKAGEPYNFFRVADEYVATLYWEGYYDPARNDYKYSARAANIEELEARAESAGKQLLDDIRRGLYIVPKLELRGEPPIFVLKAMAEHAQNP